MLILLLEAVSANATHLHTIVSYGSNSCVEEEDEESSRQVTKPRHYPERFIRALERECAMEIKLQKELARVQIKIANKKAASLSVALENMRIENDETKAELARLKQMRPVNVNNNNTSPAKRRAPVKRNATSTAAVPNKKKATKAHQQQARLEGEAALDPAALAEAERRAEAERLAEQVRLAESMAAQDTYYESLMRPYADGPVNIGIVMPSMIRLHAYITLFLKTTRAPNANGEIRALLDHHFLLNYRLSLCYNINSNPTHSDYERATLEIQRKRDAMNINSFSVRYNLSNILVHTAFIKKAIEFAQTVQHRPIILSNFPHMYAAEILQKWYPNLNSGNGYIITPDLKIPAVASLQGQGHNKHCCYCGLQYIACSNGVLKHAHQVKNCDYIANLSNDERVIITTVLANAQNNEELREHAFIANRDETSLFRRASQEEEFFGAFVVSPLSGEHLRINMPVLLRMRKRTYLDMIARITSLDTHGIKMNLNAVRLFTYQLDCFGLNGPRFQKNKKPTKKQLEKQQENGVINKIQKEDGFLYKTLIDYEGNQFRRSKFADDGKTPLRDFTMTADGFGDDMFFSMPQVRSMEEINRQVEMNLMMNMNLNGFAPIETLMIEANPLPPSPQPQQQQQLLLPAPTIEVVEEMSVEHAVEDVSTVVVNRHELRLESNMDLEINRSVQNFGDEREYEEFNTNNNDDDDMSEFGQNQFHMWQTADNSSSYFSSTGFTYNTGPNQFGCDDHDGSFAFSDSNHLDFESSFAPKRSNSLFNNSNSTSSWY